MKLYHSAILRTEKRTGRRRGWTIRKNIIKKIKDLHSPPEMSGTSKYTWLYHISFISADLDDLDPRLMTRFQKRIQVLGIL